MDKNLLDNMSGRELKEMIDNKVITFEELDNAALEKIMNFEIDMLCHGSGDMMTIRRCSELLEKRNNDETLNKEKVISIINKAKNEHIIIVNEEGADQAKAKIGKRQNLILRRIGLIAAVLTLMIATTVIVAAAFGVNIFEYIGEIVRQDEGAQITVDEFTFYHNGESKKYSSIEEMIEKENLDIMYPTKWPEGVNVERVTKYISERGTDMILILTNKANVCFSVEINPQETNGTHNDCIVFKHNGATYYIFFEDTINAYCSYNGCHYSIQANNYDELIMIIENLRK